MDTSTIRIHEKVKRGCFIAECSYLAYMCFLLVRFIKHSGIDFIEYFLLFAFGTAVILYCLVIFLYSGKDDKPLLLELVARSIYLIAALHLFILTASPCIQIVIILPTVVMALSYQRKYSAIFAASTSLLLIISTCINQHIEPGNLSILISFIWLNWYLISIFRESLLKSHADMQRMLEKEKLAAIGQMAAGIAHEVRNPLTTIKGFVQLLDKFNGVKDPETLKSYLFMIDKEINRLNDLINDFLQYAKPKKPQLSNSNLNNILYDLEMMVRNHCVNNNVRFELVYNHDLPYIKCDKNQIKQVILNIVLNGIDSMNDTTEKLLVITTNYDANHVFLRISDTGCGISPEEINKIFTPFYTSKNNGTGLGLSLCNSIIEDHQGEIKVESVVGQGTIFTILLPRVLFTN